MLHFDFYEGPTHATLVVLHGLFGSAKNVSSLARLLTSVGQVYAYDARNHGRSHHTETHNLDELVDDLGEFLAEHKIRTPILIGHSMGGLTAMAFAAKHPKVVRALAVLDIAPRTYPIGHAEEIAAQRIAISEFATRRDIDEVMRDVLPDETLRQFVQTNITRDETGQFVWMNNVRAIERSPSRTVFPAHNMPLYSGPVIAIRGGRSNYVTEGDVELMRQAFPALKMHTIVDAEHWLHYTHTKEVADMIIDALSKSPV